MRLGLAVWAAGLKDAKVKTAAGDLYDINAVVEANGDPEQDEIEIKGDDEKKATFVTGISEDITITCNSISFDVLQAITGTNYASSATGIEIPLGTDSQENPPYVELQAFSQAKNVDGTMGTLKKVWHKVQFYSIKPSMAGEQEVNVEIKARAYQTDENIVGDPLASNRLATINFVTN